MSAFRTGPAAVDAQGNTIVPAAPPLPTVGRIVHYYPLPSGTVPLAAIVTAVVGWTVALTVFEPGNRTADALVNVSYSAEPKPGHWSWPPRSER